MNKLYSGLRSNPINQYDNYSNYESLVYTFSGSVIDKINKKDSLYKVPTAKENLIYTGLEQILINASSTGTGTVKYSSDNINWSTTIPCGTNAGTYTLYWKVVGDIDHNDTESATIIASIAKAAPSYTAPTGKDNLEYTGEVQVLLNAGSTNDGVIKYSLDGTNWSTNVPTGTEVQTYTVYWKLEGDANHNDVEQASISVEIASVTPAYEFVDLGLPSGTKWAKMNIGASSETDYGLFFQWGDTQGYTADQVGSGEGQKYFGWADYKYSNNGGSSASDMTKYNSNDGLVTLQASDDAVFTNWDGSWKMPTEEQFNELLNSSYCTNAWTSITVGDTTVYGRLFTSKSNGNTLFFPYAGYYSDGSVASYGFYWSSSLYASNVTLGRLLYFSSSHISVSLGNRSYGCSVRAVQSAS